MGLVSRAKSSHALLIYWLITVINASHQNSHPISHLIVPPPAGWLSFSLPKFVVNWLYFWLLTPPPLPKWPTDEKWGAMWEVGQTAECQVCSSGGGTVDKRTCTQCSWYGFNPLPIGTPVSARHTHAHTHSASLLVMQASPRWLVALCPWATGGT